MTEFERMAKRKKVKCDICGEIMHPMYGGGWDNDRLVCAKRFNECGAEIVFPTSTPVDETEPRTKAGPTQSALTPDQDGQ